MNLVEIVTWIHDNPMPVIAAVAIANCIAIVTVIWAMKK